MAKWVRLNSPFDYRVPGRRAVIHFPAGYTAYLTEEMWTEAERVGAGVVVPKPKGAKVTKGGTVSYFEEK